MALQALSTYKDREDVKPVIEKALNYLRNNQTEYGGFKDSGKENVESAAQVLVALTSLGLDPLDPANKFGDKNYNLVRSEEHTSELQSRQYLVCRLLLEKKKNTNCHYSLEQD